MTFTPSPKSRITGACDLRFSTGGTTAGGYSEIQQLDVLAMTPMDALNQLYLLKEKALKEKLKELEAEREKVLAEKN